MDAQERAEKIGDAVRDQAMRDPIIMGLAAVRAAYEIDGVGELVEEAEEAKSLMDNYGWCRESSDAVNAVGFAAARVREAMGGGV